LRLFSEQYARYDVFRGSGISVTRSAMSFGKTLDLDRDPYIVVGVAPWAFAGSLGGETSSFRSPRARGGSGRA
jgi:hypothetical protein